MIYRYSSGLLHWHWGSRTKNMGKVDPITNHKETQQSVNFGKNVGVYCICTVLLLQSVILKTYMKIFSKRQSLSQGQVKQ